ncbi:MAG TPA: YiiX/YebB-like N1pC/P60 family cysteine hydrolase [Pantanalinema sp.]
MNMSNLIRKQLAGPTASNRLTKTVAARVEAVLAKRMPKVAGMADDAVMTRLITAYNVKHAPAEGLWYRIKKTFADLFSNVTYYTPDARGVTQEMAAQVRPKLKAGDILLRRTEGTSGNFLIPSWWKHAGVYVGDGKVVDAAFKGVHKGSFEKFMTDGDAVMVLRAKDLSSKQREAIARFANLQVGKPYDFDLDFVDQARMTCTELANHAVEAGTGREVVEKNMLGAVVGDAFKNRNFELVWTNRPDMASLLD